MHTPTPWTTLPVSIKMLDHPWHEGDHARLRATVNFFHGRDIPTERIAEGGFWSLVDVLSSLLSSGAVLTVLEDDTRELAQDLLTKLGIEP